MNEKDSNEHVAARSASSGDSRRRFLQKAAAGGAVAWVAPTILSTSAAAAATQQCVNETVDWSGFLTTGTLATLNAGGTVSYDLGSNSTLDITFDTSGMGSGVATVSNAATSPLGGELNDFLELTLDSTADLQYADLIFEFVGTPLTSVSGLTFTLLDVDRSIGPGPTPLWQDRVELTATLGASSVLATSVTPVQYPTAAQIGGSDVITGQLDPSGPDGATPNTSTDSNVAVVYGPQIDRLVFRYLALDGNELQQIGITALELCLYE
jgi:hypothetical protein